MGIWQEGPTGIGRYAPDGSTTKADLPDGGIWTGADPEGRQGPDPLDAPDPPDPQDRGT